MTNWPKRAVRYWEVTSQDLISAMCCCFTSNVIAAADNYRYGTKLALILFGTTQHVSQVCAQDPGFLNLTLLQRQRRPT